MPQDFSRSIHKQLQDYIPIRALVKAKGAGQLFRITPGDQISSSALFKSRAMIEKRANQEYGRGEATTRGVEVD